MGEATGIAITVNGVAHRVPAGLTVAGLLAHLGLKAEQSAVERNRRLVRRPDHAATPVHEGDAFEIVTFFGGG